MPKLILRPGDGDRITLRAVASTLSIELYEACVAMLATAKEITGLTGEDDAVAALMNDSGTPSDTNAATTALVNGRLETRVPEIIDTLVPDIINDEVSQMIADITPDEKRGGINDRVDFQAEYGDAYIGHDSGFDRTGNPTTVPPGWTALAWGSLITAIERRSAFVMRGVGPAVTADNWRGIYRSLAGAPTNWTAFVRISHGTDAKAFSLGPGLALRQSSNGKMVTVHRIGAGAMEGSTWNTSGTGSDGPVASVVFSNYAVMPAAEGQIIKLNKTGSTYTWSVSSDEGETWLELPSMNAAMASLGIVPDQIGMFMNLTGAGIQADAAIHWFRLR